MYKAASLGFLKALALPVLPGILLYNTVKAGRMQNDPWYRAGVRMQEQYDRDQEAAGKYSVPGVRYSAVDLAPQMGRSLV